MEQDLIKKVNNEVGASSRVRRGGAAALERRIQALIENILEHGYVIIPNAFSEEEIREAKEELRHLETSLTTEKTPSRSKGRNTFEGLKTHRMYGLAGKSRVFDKFALHPDVLAINDYFLDPAYLLNSFQSINILPGEKPQTLHCDDGYITIPRPHKPFGTVRLPLSLLELKSRS